MSATAAVHSYGSTLGYSATSGGSYTNVAEVVEVDGPSLQVSEVDVTSLASPSAHKEFLPGLVDPGDIKLKLNLLTSQFSTVWGFAAGRTFKYWKITLSNGDTAVAYGFIKELHPSAPDNKQLMADMTIKVSGPITYTPAP
jgi:hypothetical protein